MFNKLKIEVCQLTVAEINNPLSVTNLTPSPPGRRQKPFRQTYGLQPSLSGTAYGSLY